MDDDLAFSESERPRYLLPEGCKDLYDVILRQEEADTIQKKSAVISAALEKYASKFCPVPPPSITIPDPVSVEDLARALHLKPYKLIAILLKVDCFASTKSEIAFSTAFKACALLHVIAIKVDGS